MGLISCHITPLVINSLGGRHTRIHTYRHPHRHNFKKPGVPACGWHASGLKRQNAMQRRQDILVKTRQLRIALHVITLVCKLKDIHYMFLYIL